MRTKSQSVFGSVKLFGIKPLGKGCRFGIKINSKKQDGTYTKGVFINCKYKEMLNEGIYTLDGFFGDNEYNDTNTLEFIVMNATLEQELQPTRQAPQVHYEKHTDYRVPPKQPMPAGTLPIDDSDVIPF